MWIDYTIEISARSLFSLRKPDPPLNLNGKRVIFRMNRLYRGIIDLEDRDSNLHASSIDIAITYVGGVCEICNLNI